MAQAYTPGLLVTSQTRYLARRALPIAGEVLVKAGQQVAAQDIVARADLPGDITPVNLSNLLSISPGDVAGCLLKQPGDSIEIGDEIAKTKGIFGFFQSSYTAKISGTIESISSVTGQMLIRGAPLPVEVRAFVSGRVAEVLPKEGCIIEADVALVQGIFGIGGETYGPIRMVSASPEQDLTPDQLTADLKGAIVIGGARVPGETVRKAIELGIAAIVAGGIDDSDLRDILGYDLGVAITGTEKIGITLVITEGFGDIAMAKRTFELLKSREGAAASVNGATQIRAGVMRPEIVIPVTNGAAGNLDVQQGGGVLQSGSRVRIIRDPWFGRLGTVASLPHEPQVLGSGSKARVLTVTCSNGEVVTVPRANVEIVSE